LERQQRIEHLLRLIDLEGLQSRYPDELSGGQRQRVALARALAPEPHLLLLDEPFSNLDTDRRVQMREQVRHILKASGATSVIVTHDQEEALFMGDHLALLRAGRLEQVDRPETVFMQPATRFVAEFLGRAEFIPATVGPQGLQTELGILLQTVDLEAGEKVSIGFRADDLTFVPDPNGDSMILARFFQGASTLYRLRLPSGLIVHSLQPHTLLLSPGTRVQALLEAGHPLPVFQGERAIPSRYQPVGHLRQAVIQSQLDG
jgi:iron(III) transport system ATP-binding protein